jgi:hypothetical protein
LPLESGPRNAGIAERVKLNNKEFFEKLRSKKVGKTIFNPLYLKIVFGRTFWDVLFSGEKVDPRKPCSNRYGKSVLLKQFRSSVV